MAKRKSLTHYRNTYEEWLRRQPARPIGRRIERIYIQDTYEQWISKLVQEKITKKSKRARGER